MTLSNFVMAVSGVTGTAFRNTLSSIIEALASNSRASTEPPTKYPGMTQVFVDGGTDSLRYYTDTGQWVTLLPDLSAQYGGLSSVISAGGLLSSENIFTNRNEFQGQLEVGGAADFNSTANFDGAVTFTSDVSFDINPGFSTSSSVASQIDSAISGLLRRRNSFTRTPSLNSTDTFSHNLGVTPDLVVCRLQFRQNVAGYDSGHVIKMPLGVHPAIDTGSPKPASGITVKVDSSTIQVAIGPTIPVVNRSNNSIFQLNNSAQYELQFIVYTVD